jgi:hypothetical protein
VEPKILTSCENVNGGETEVSASELMKLANHKTVPEDITALLV